MDLKRLAFQEQKRQIAQILRLAWPDLQEDFEIVLVNKNPYMTPDGLIKLEKFRFHTMQPVTDAPSDSLPFYEFIAQRRRIQNQDYVYMLATPSADGESLIHLGLELKDS